MFMKHTYFGRSRGQRPASYHISLYVRRRIHVYETHILWQESRTEASVLSHFTFLAQRANVVFRPFVDAKSQVSLHTYI